VVILLALITLVLADINLHNPKGSNDRLNEANTNRDNDNRLFDSQSNDKGGYCVAPSSVYYEQSFLQIEWTNQHGCGTQQANVDCDLIIQYMSDASIRDGQTTDTIPYPPDGDTEDPDQMTDGEYYYGMHESQAYFQACDRRRRNYGLFFADQNDPDDPNKSARYTRQQDNNNRYGYECPEERDYYPYWHPTPWKDIVIFTSRTSRCQFFQTQSQNVMSKYWCVSDALDTGKMEYYETASKCYAAGGTWQQVYPWNIPAPECFAAGWNRDNHLGNGVGGYANSYQWTLPKWSDVKGSAVVSPINGSATQVAPCVLRIRYNVSTGDYRGGVENTGNSYNHGGFADRNLNGPTISPVTQNPAYDSGSNPYYTGQEHWYLQLAMDTSQFCRTFQERTHVFYIQPRPASLIGATIYNLMVRGKRGNIVQTYPAVEYDFVPNTLQMTVGDYIHFHVGGCDTQPQGQAGQGRDQTDRSNIVQNGMPVTTKSDMTMYGGLGNKPKSYSSVNMWGQPGTNVALTTAWKMANLDQYNNVQCTSVTDTDCCYTQQQLTDKYQNDNNDRANDVQNCALLNANGANGFQGMARMSTPGTFHYLSTRNNNFSNRSQKGQLVVGTALSIPTIVALVAGGGAAVGAIGVSAAAWSGASCLATVHI